MGLMDLFKKPSKQQRLEEEQERAKTEDLDLYPGMRVEVTTDDGRLFLAAELMELRGNMAKLKPFIDGSLLSRSDQAIPVTIRGKSSKDNSAVVVEATVRCGPNDIWLAEHLELVKRVDNRASFRIEVDLEAEVAPGDQPIGEKEPGRVINISTGGAKVSMGTRRNVGDKFLMWVNLPPNTTLSGLVCQIVRVDERRYDYFEYGCRFLGLDPEDENLVLRSIFDAQNFQ